MISCTNKREQLYFNTSTQLSPEKQDTVKYKPLVNDEFKN